MTDKSKLNFMCGSKLIESGELKAGNDDPWNIAIVEALYEGYGKKYNHIPTGDDGKPTFTISINYKPLIAKLQAQGDKMIKEGEIDYCYGINFAIEEIEKHFGEIKENDAS